MSYIRFSAVCDKGEIREENQDAIFIQGFDEKCSAQSVKLYSTIELTKAEKIAVFDGMGGEECGKIASEIARNVFSKNCNTEISLEDICLKINREICEYMEKNGIFSMGSTAAMVSVNHSVQFCNIGDSKIYKVSDSGIEQLSVDHVTVIGKYKKRRVLNQHLGIPETEMIIEPYSGEITYNDKDVFIICSDGLSDMMTDAEIFDIAIKNDIECLANVLFEAAMKSGGKDNISIVAFKITE